MTTKDRHVLDFWWRKLFDCAAAKGEGVTAGELAEYVGQSRTTAKRYLIRLVKEKAAMAGKSRHWNKANMTVYVAIGEDR
jgi:response regulator of citrate/malate metabolism